MRSLLATGIASGVLALASMATIPQRNTNMAVQTAWSGGTVTYLSCMATDICSVALSSAPPATYPPCANAPINTMNLSVDGAAGQAMLKLLTAAKAAGWTVTLYGYPGSSTTNYGSCDLASGMAGQEDLMWVQVH